MICVMPEWMKMRSTLVCCVDMLMACELSNNDLSRPVGEQRPYAVRQIRDVVRGEIVADWTLVGELPFRALADVGEAFDERRSARERRAARGRRPGLSNPVEQRQAQRPGSASPSYARLRRRR